MPASQITISGALAPVWSSAGTTELTCHCFRVVVHSTAKADDFVKEPDTRRVVFNINKALSDVTTESAGFTEQLWGAINEVIKLPECSVYSYIPDLDEDPLSTGTLYVCMCSSLLLPPGGR